MVEILGFSPIRHYITDLHRQDREMGPAPYSHVDSAGHEYVRSPIVCYITDLHHLDRELGPAPITYIELPRWTDSTVRPYITALHHRDREMGPSPFTIIELQFEKGLRGIPLITTASFHVEVH